MSLEYTEVEFLACLLECGAMEKPEHTITQTNIRWKRVYKWHARTFPKSTWQDAYNFWMDYSEWWEQQHGH